MSSNASRVIYNINAQSFRQALCLSESNLQQSIPFNEENLICAFRQVENEVRLGFLSSLLNVDQPIEKVVFPYSLQEFKDCVKPFFAMLSQVLGLDSDRKVREFMVSLAYTLSQSETNGQDINFDEFLAENIHSQLMNFHSKKTFRHQTLFLKMIIKQNYNDLQSVDPYLFIENVNLSEELGGRTFVQFANKVMSKIYKLIYDQELPRVIDLMRSQL